VNYSQYNPSSLDPNDANFPLPYFYSAAPKNDKGDWVFFIMKGDWGVMQKNWQLVDIR